VVEGGILLKTGGPYLLKADRYIERFHRTLLDEHLRVAGRTTWYESLEQMQGDIDTWLETYNTKRPTRAAG
jgi:transposase InsO family protein